MKVLVVKVGAKASVIGATLLVVVATVCSSGFFSDTAQAATCGPNRYSCNNSENFARSNCGGSDTGALWFNTGSTANDNTGGYYTDDVAITGNATSVTVYIRGSACDTGRPSGYGVYATDIRPGGDATSQRLQMGGTTVLYRGNFTGNIWTTQGSSLAVTLDVSGLATNNQGRVDTASITISLGRCYGSSPVNRGWNGVANGPCYYDPVTVNITRAANPAQWSINGQSYIQAVTNAGVAPNAGAHVAGNIGNVLPGNRLYWWHDLRNRGPNNMDRQVSISIGKSGFSNGWNGATNVGTRSGTSGELFFRDYPSGAAESRSYATYDVTQADVGKTLCEDIEWSPASWNNNGLGKSTARCATVPYKYTLTPLITTAPQPLLREGVDTIQVTASVVNAGPTLTDNVNWYVTRFIVPPGGGYTKSGVAATACTQFSGYKPGSCQSIKNGTRSFPSSSTTYVPGPNATPTFTDTIPGGVAAGSKICYLTSVDKGTATTTWKHSAVSCSTIERIPFVQVLGNDLRVGSTFGGANLTSGATSFVFDDEGSWGEYSILAPGGISGIASGSAANGGNAGAASSWSKLTFANTGAMPGCPSGFGCFTGATSMGKIPSVSTFVKTATYGGTPLNYNKGAASFSASNIPSIVPGANLNNFSKSVSITTTGDITIDQDITYSPGTLHAVSDIPQLILIGRNINITSNVKHIDAWLVATGTVNTCSDVAQANLRVSTCTNQLTVTGAIMANQLLLDRTYHDQANPQEASEKLNLRSDAYVWASDVARQNGQWQTVYSTDLPPRY